jgi:hypothetical protein
MWTTKNRKRYDRRQLRYPSDLTDQKWARVAPLIPPGRVWKWRWHHEPDACPFGSSAFGDGRRGVDGAAGCRVP